MARGQSWTRARSLGRQLSTAVRTRWLVGIRAGITLGLPLLIGVAVGHASYGAIASMGALAGFSAGAAPWAYRAKVIPVVGAATMVIVPVSGLLSSTPWAAIVWVGFVAAFASFICMALEMPPPREYLIVLAALAGTGIPVDVHGALREVWLIAGGAAIAWIVALAFTFVERGPSPAQKAVDGAHAAVAGILRAAGTADAATARQAAVAAIHTSRVALRQTTRREAIDLAGRQASAEVLLATALSISIECNAPLGSASADAVLAGPGSQDQPAAIPAPLTAALAKARTLNTGREAEHLGSPSVFERLLNAIASRTVVLPTALRIGLAVAIGAAVGRALGLSHSYWVGLTCAAALQANNVTMLMQRSTHRFIGTVAGIGLAGAIFAFSPTAAAIAVAATLAQLVAETVIVANYAVAVTFITVIALSVYDLAVPHAKIGSTIDARLLDTLIGVALVAVLRLLLWPKTNSTRLPRARADTVRAISGLLRARWLGGTPESRAAADAEHRLPDVVRAQHVLQERLLSLRARAADASADRLRTAGSLHDQAVTLAVEDLADLALSIPYDRPLPNPVQVRALLEQLDTIAAALEGRAAPPAAPTSALDGYPRTLAATKVLSSALAVDPH